MLPLQLSITHKFTYIFGGNFIDEMGDFQSNLVLNMCINLLNDISGSPDVIGDLEQGQFILNTKCAFIMHGL